VNRGFKREDEMGGEIIRALRASILPCRRNEESPSWAVRLRQIDADELIATRHAKCRRV